MKDTSNAKENIVRKHILFFGRVQGVGFRYCSINKAKNIGLTGWVKNLYDGSVEMEVQGMESDIELLIQYLNQERYIRIERMEVEKMELKNERDFLLY